MSDIALSSSLLGLRPFFAFAPGAAGHLPETSEPMLVSLIDYRVLCGRSALEPGFAPQASRPALRFGTAALPLVVAWIGLILARLVAPSVAVAVAILGYLATVMTEHRAPWMLPGPPKYMWLRWTFSIVAIIPLVFVLLPRGVKQTIVF